MSSKTSVVHAPVAGRKLIASVNKTKRKLISRGSSEEKYIHAKPCEESMSKILSVLDKEEKTDGKSAIRKAPTGAEVALREAFRLFAGPRTFQFVLTGSTTLIAAGGTGAFIGFIPFDPNTFSYNEYSSLSSLFDEVRLCSAEASWTPLLSAAGTIPGSATPVIFNQMQVGVDRDSFTTATASYAQVVRLDGSQSIARISGDHLPVVTRYRAPGNRVFATTAVSSTINPPTGCVGCFRYSSVTALTPGTDYYIVVLKALMEFRNRV